MEFADWVICLMVEDINIDKINGIALRAGMGIMKVYGNPQIPEFKSDGSPLTTADKLSHNIIVRGLREVSPDVPIISEEGEQVAYEVRKDWKYFWLVDPLDGTKEFLKRNGEFTVNIALIESGTPILGVIYAPALDVLYFGIRGKGAFKKVGDAPPAKIHADSFRRAKFIVAKSRSHSSADEEKFLSQFDTGEIVSVGSSLKFCLIAEGKAHIYYRHGPTMEWDTAAGHAIAECAAARVSGLSYGKPQLLNASFLCSTPFVQDIRFV